ncbi:S1 family peptidase, partial [Streptomyces sp. NPDC054863]
MKVRKIPRLAVALALLGSAVVAANVGTVGEPAATEGLALEVTGASYGLAATANAVHAATGMPKDRAVAMLQKEDRLSAEADSLRKRLGNRFAGVWIDGEAGTVYANALDEATASEIRKAGAVPRKAQYTQDELRRVKAALDSVANPPKDSSWGVREVDNRVVVDLPASARGTAVLETLLAGARLGTEDAKRVKVEYHRGSSSRMGLIGGDGLNTATGGCSAGIAVSQGTGTFVITAGHCTREVGEMVTRNDPQRTRIGAVYRRQFPTKDFALVGVEIPMSHSPFGAWINKYDGTMAKYAGRTKPPSGKTICKSGARTGYTCGKVFDGDADSTWTDPDGNRTTNLLKLTGIVSDGGDSGGAVVDGAKAVGTVVGGNSSFQQLYVQPIDRVLEEYPGMEVLGWR